MSHWLGELVKVGEAGTRDGYCSHCWKVSLSRAHMCIGVFVSGFTICKSPG